MPGIVGFSDKSKSIVFFDFEPEIRIRKINFLVGYDIIEYSKRYENDFNKFYFTGNFGLGLGWLSLSPEIKERAKAETRKTDIYRPLTFVMDGMLEAGYMFQRRAKRLSGLGASLNFGYRARGTFMGSGQSKTNDTTIDSNELALEFDRYDLWHGPFVQANLIF